MFLQLRLQLQRKYLLQHHSLDCLVSKHLGQHLLRLMHQFQQGLQEFQTDYKVKINPKNKELIHNFVKHLAAEYEQNFLITRSNID